MATTYDVTKDAYANFAPTLGVPGSNAAAITPSDTADLAAYPKAIVVTAAGNLVVLPLKAPDDGSHLITFTALPVGYLLPFRVRRVMATGPTTLATVAAIFD
jgi:hypothetical protein